MNYPGLKTAVVQEGEGVEFEVREAVPIVQQVEEVSDAEMKRKAVVQEGDDVECEVREAVPIVQQVEEV